MIAKIVTFVLPLLAPTVAYFIWAYYRDKRLGTDATGEERKRPWFYLIGAGLILASITTFALGLIVEGPDRGTYVPPHMKDGELVPGTFVPEE